MIDRLARSLGTAVVAAFVSIAPSTVDPWRFDVNPPPARILPVGDPVTPLRPRD